MATPKGFETSRAGQAGTGRSWIHRVRDEAVKAAKGVKDAGSRATRQAPTPKATSALRGTLGLAGRVATPLAGAVAVAPAALERGMTDSYRAARPGMVQDLAEQTRAGSVPDAVKTAAGVVGTGALSVAHMLGFGDRFGVSKQPQAQPQAQPESQPQPADDFNGVPLNEFYGEGPRGPARPFQVQDGTRGDYRERLRALQGDALRERILGELDRMDASNPQRAEMWRSLRQRVLGTNTETQGRDDILRNSSGRAGLRRVAGKLENANSYNDQMQARYDARMLLESANRAKYRKTADSRRDAAMKLLDQARGLRSDDLSAQGNAGTLYGTDAGIDEQNYVTDSENQRANALRAREMLGLEADLLRAEDTNTNNINNARRYLLDSARASQDNERRDMSSLETNQVTNTTDLREALLREQGAAARAQESSDAEPKADLKTQQKMMGDLAAAETPKAREGLLELFSRMAQQGDVNAQQMVEAEAIRQLREMTDPGFAGLGALARDVSRVVDVNNPLLEPRMGSSRSLTDRILQPSVNLDDISRLAVDPETGRLIQFNGDGQTQSRVADLDELPRWMQQYFATRLPVYNKE